MDFFGTIFALAPNNESLINIAGLFNYQFQTTTIFYYYLYQKEKYTFAPQIARKLVMAGQAGTRTTLTKTSYHVNL